MNGATDLAACSDSEGCHAYKFALSRLLKNYLRCHCYVKSRLKMLIYSS